MTEVALEAASPHAPLVIQQMLDKLAIKYMEVPEHLAKDAERKVQAVLLADAVGALMVLFPQSQLHWSASRKCSASISWRYFPACRS